MAHVRRPTTLPILCPDLVSTKPGDLPVEGLKDRYGEYCALCLDYIEPSERDGHHVIQKMGAARQLGIIGLNQHRTVPVHRSKCHKFYHDGLDGDAIALSTALRRDRIGITTALHEHGFLQLAAYANVHLYNEQVAERDYQRAAETLGYIVAESQYVLGAYSRILRFVTDCNSDLLRISPYLRAKVAVNEHWMGSGRLARELVGDKPRNQSDYFARAICNPSRQSVLNLCSMRDVDGRSAFTRDLILAVNYALDIDAPKKSTLANEYFRRLDDNDAPLNYRIHSWYYDLSRLRSHEAPKAFTLLTRIQYVSTMLQLLAPLPLDRKLIKGSPFEHCAVSEFKHFDKDLLRSLRRLALDWNGDKQTSFSRTGIHDRVLRIIRGHIFPY